MARPVRNLDRYQRGAVSGSAAYDFDYLERQRRRHAERSDPPEHVYHEESYRSPREQAIETKRRAQQKVRPRQHISPSLLLGSIALIGMVVVLLVCYVQLNAISNEVVNMQSELTALETEHVSLLTRYEQTFDMATIKNAAERAGMKKPDSVQIFYMDISEPDSVTVYEDRETGVLSRVFTSLGQGFCAAVEYFR